MLTGDGEVVDVVSGPGRQGAVLPVPRQAGVEQAGVVSHQHLRAEPQPLHHPYEGKDIKSHHPYEGRDIKSHHPYDKRQNVAETKLHLYDGKDRPRRSTEAEHRAVRNLRCCRKVTIQLLKKSCIHNFASQVVRK